LISLLGGSDITSIVSSTFLASEDASSVFSFSCDDLISSCAVLNPRPEVFPFFLYALNWD
jgi:hypothetical protein